MNERVTLNSLLTLHYRIAAADGTELVSTFDATPATLQLGNGELAPSLERCLEGMTPNERRSFDLAPEQAFGMHNPNLLEWRDRSSFPEAAELGPQAVLEFKAAGGSAYTGRVSEIDEKQVLIDFNHPLAGKRIRFEVQVIGIL